MTIETLRSFFMWCFIINYCLLILWFVIFRLAHDPGKKLIEFAFRCEIKNYDSLTCIGISIYKIGVILFNLVPWIALTLLR